MAQLAARWELTTPKAPGSNPVKSPAFSGGPYNCRGGTMGATGSALFFMSDNELNLNYEISKLKENKVNE